MPVSVAVLRTWQKGTASTLLRGVALRPEIHRIQSTIIKKVGSADIVKVVKMSTN